MKLLAIFGLFTVLQLIAGCTSMQNIDPHSRAFLNDNQAIVVIGIANNQRLNITSGIQQENGWKSRGGLVIGYDHKPENGYIVARLSSLKGKNRYGLTRISERRNADRQFRVCKGIDTFTFTIPPATVGYIGHINFTDTDTDNQVNVNLSENLPKAKAFMTEHYPKLVDDLRLLDANIEPLTNISCNFALTDFLDVLSGALLGVSGAL